MTTRSSVDPANRPLRLGCVGLAGYAEAMSGVVLEHGGSTSPPVELVAAAGPEAAGGHPRVAELEGHGVRVFAELDAMLSEAELDAAWVLAPIHLHEPLTRRCLDAGLHVLCEKPAAGSVVEVESMIEQRDAAGRVLLIGFQDVYDPSLLKLKRRMLEGRLGELKRISVHGCWPRGESYFTRNNWAGRLTVDGRPVYDSPLNNALSHYAHVGLFLAGTEMGTATRLASGEVELYRAADIESFDTVLIRGRTDTGVEMSIGFTHAAASNVGPRIEIEMSRGHAVRLQTYSIWQPPEGDAEEIKPSRPMRVEMLEHFTRRCLAQDVGDQPGGRLEMAREHTRLVESVHHAASIVPVPDDAIEPVDSKQGTVRTIPGIEDTLLDAVRRGGSLHDTGRYPWSKPPVPFSAM